MHKLLPRIEKKISYEPNSGCWLWIGCWNSENYGSVKINGKMRPAHRVVYETLRGPIPNGLELDHLCRLHCCVNPEHLEPVTKKINALRGFGVGAINARRTICKNGHLLKGYNVIYYRERRYCRKCGNIANTKQRAKNRRS